MDVPPQFPTGPSEPQPEAPFDPAGRPPVDQAKAELNAITAASVQSGHLSSEAEQKVQEPGSLLFTDWRARFPKTAKVLTYGPWVLLAIGLLIVLLIAK